jgi:hypothetical protein
MTTIRKKNKKKPQIPKRRQTKTRLCFYYKGRMISREDYWEMKIKDLVLENKDLSMNFHFSPQYLKRIFILQREFEVKTPIYLLKHLINQEFARICAVNVKIPKKKKNKKLKE